MKLRVAKCRQEDLDSFDAGAFPAYFCEGVLPALRQTLLSTEKTHSFSVFADDKLVAVGGFVILWRGVAEVWVAISNKDWAKKNLRKVIAAFTMTMNDVSLSAGLRRLQCTVRADSPASIRFVEGLGFESEGLLVGYGVDGADHVMFARVIC